MTREERWMIEKIGAFVSVRGPDTATVDKWSNKSNDGIEVVPVARLVEAEAENERLRYALSDALQGAKP